MFKLKNKTPSLISVLLVVFIAGIFNMTLANIQTNSDKVIKSVTAVSEQSNHSKLTPLNAHGQRRYVIRFNDPALARFSGSAQFAAIPRKDNHKIEVDSIAVANYVNYLKQQQQAFLDHISVLLGRPVNALLSYQYATNGLTVELTVEEAESVKLNSNVMSVRADRLYSLDTDAGPTLIGANNVWDGTPPSVGMASGEGIVIGTLDTGLNFDHPSFADVGDDAYDHTNPLGSENYVGVCDPSNSEQFIASYVCNDKLIGGYDFINALVPKDGSFDLPGPEDENGHGSHTTSIAAGNVVMTAEVIGITGLTISGVAPHANIVHFDVCYNPIQPGEGCAGAAVLASLDQVIADGLVDVINYSISGGSDPWNEDVSLAFLNVTDSGIYVSTSAGDLGPGPGTLGHLEPWTSTVGATTHDRVFDNPLTGTIANGHADVMADFSSRGPSPFEQNKPDLVAPGVDILAALNDGMVAPSVDDEYGIISGTSMSAPFNAGSAALLKELHPTWTAAELKSALMLTAITAGVTKEDGITPADSYDRGAGRIQVDVATSVGLVLDETVASFLSADPATGGNPKTLNLASYKNEFCVGTCSFQREFTSVANDSAKYVTKLLGLPGDVTPASFTVLPGETIILNIEIDGNAMVPGATNFGELSILPQAPTSEFSMTAPLSIDDGGYQTNDPISNMNCSTITVSDITLPTSVSVELGINHTWVNDLTVKLFNPNGEEFAMLNRPESNATLSHSFPITFSDSGTTDAEELGSGLAFGDIVCAINGQCDYFGNPDEELSSAPDFAALTITDPNGEWQLCGGDSVEFLKDNNIQLASLSFSEQNLPELTIPNLHMPLIVIGFPGSPAINVTPTSLNATLDADMSTELTVNISNSETVVLPLNWVFDTTSTSNLVEETFYDQPQTGSFAGNISDVFIDGITDPGVYSADSFELMAETDIDGFVFEGFLTNAGQLPDDQIVSFTVKVYANENGIPPGHPEDGIGNELFSATIPADDYSLEYLSLSSPQDNIRVNVKNFSGESWTLSAGTYWVMAYAHATGPNSWAWFTGVPGDDLLPHVIDPQDFFEEGLTSWTDLITVSGNVDYSGLAFEINSLKDCGASWISYASTNGTLAVGADENVTVTLNSTGLGPGAHTAVVCVASDDTDDPLIAIPVTLTVDGLSDLIFIDGFESNP